MGGMGRMGRMGGMGIDDMYGMKGKSDKITRREGILSSRGYKQGFQMQRRIG